MAMLYVFLQLLVVWFSHRCFVIQLKSHVDVIIDRCAALQNLRVAIVNLRMKSRSTKATEEEQKAAMERGLHYLERYFYLICFAGTRTLERHNASGS